MNEINTFHHEHFGSIRTVTVDGEVWLVGKDVAEALGYERPTKAVQDHVDAEDKDEIPIRDSIGRMQNTPIINESGLYSLVLGSKLPGAKRFRRWVTAEVLPSIRKTGEYRTPGRHCNTPPTDPLIRDQIAYVAALRRSLQKFMELKDRISAEMADRKAALSRAKTAFGKVRDLERDVDKDIAERTAALESAIDTLEMLSSGGLPPDVLDLISGRVDPMQLSGDDTDW